MISRSVVLGEFNADIRMSQTSGYLVPTSGRRSGEDMVPEPGGEANEHGLHQVVIRVQELQVGAP